MKDRLMKMNRNNKSIMLRALTADYKDLKAAGRDLRGVVDLVCHIDATENERLFLSDEEYHLMRDSLNRLRNQRIATGGYTDATDDALLKLIKAKPPMLPLFR